MSTNVVLQKPRDRNITSSRIHGLASVNNAKTYLEIGVSAGDTFVNVQGMKRKVAVDPLFRFDTQSYSDEASEFISETSDAYFETLAADDWFDLIFLDGLHTFEQTYRDLCNALLHSHSKTIILIDDTLPSDAYSAIKDPRECVKARREAGITGPGPWHGDVYKTVFAMRDFHPGLDFRTIRDNGNPQTVVWQSKAYRRAPLFDDLQTISKMTYDTLQQHLNELRFATDAEVVSAVTESFAGR